MTIFSEPPTPLRREEPSQGSKVEPQKKVTDFSGLVAWDSTWSWMTPWRASGWRRGGMSRLGAGGACAAGVGGGGAAEGREEGVADDLVGFVLLEILEEELGGFETGAGGGDFGADADSGFEIAEGFEGESFEDAGIEGEGEGVDGGHVHGDAHVEPDLGPDETFLPFVEVEIALGDAEVGAGLFGPDFGALEEPVEGFPGAEEGEIAVGDVKAAGEAVVAGAGAEDGLGVPFDGFGPHAHAATGVAEVVFDAGVGTAVGCLLGVGFAADGVVADCGGGVVVRGVV